MVPRSRDVCRLTWSRRETLVRFSAGQPGYGTRCAEFRGDHCGICDNIRWAQFGLYVLL